MMFARRIVAKQIIATPLAVRSLENSANSFAQQLLANTDGAWINMGITAARFQDAGGQALASVNSDPVGLVYDYKRGEPSLGDPLTLLNNAASKNTDGTTTTVVIATDSIAYKAMRVSFSVSGIVGSFVVSSTAVDGTSVTIDSNGNHSIVLAVGASGGFVQIEGVTASRYTLTDIVVQELSGHHAFQQTVTARPALQSSPVRAVFDKTDDFWTVHFDGSINGTWIQASAEGVLMGEVAISAGALPLQPIPIYMNPNNIAQFFVINRSLKQHEKIQLRDLMIRDGSGGDFSSSTDLTGLFALNANLVSVDLSGLNTSNVINMSGMFSYCTSLASVDLSGLNTSNVTDISNMFLNCTSLASVDLSGLNTSNVINMSSMFDACEALTAIDISALNFSSTNGMQSFLAGTGMVFVVVGNALSNSPCVDYSNAFYACHLSVTSVDAILASINAAGTTYGTLGFEGSTNAIPTGGAANADVVALRARGWEINNDKGW